MINWMLPQHETAAAERISCMEGSLKPDKVDRRRLRHLTDLPNIGPAMADDLRLLGIVEPGQLSGCCPFDLYTRLGDKTGRRHDPCVLDVFISVTRFMNGEAPLPWWSFTNERKQALRERSVTKGSGR